MQRSEWKERHIRYPVVVEVRCDLCGKRNPLKGDVHHWADSDEDPDELMVTVMLTDTTDEEAEEEIEFDICPDCFKSKVAEFILANMVDRDGD